MIFPMERSSILKQTTPSTTLHHLREANCGIAGGHYVGDAMKRKIWQSGVHQQDPLEHIAENSKRIPDELGHKAE